MEDLDKLLIEAEAEREQPFIDWIVVARLIQAVKGLRADLAETRKNQAHFCSVSIVLSRKLDKAKRLLLDAGIKELPDA